MNRVLVIKRIVLAPYKANETQVFVMDEVSSLFDCMHVRLTSGI